MDSVALGAIFVDNKFFDRRYQFFFVDSWEDAGWQKSLATVDWP